MQDNNNFCNIIYVKILTCPISCIWSMDTINIHTYIQFTLCKTNNHCVQWEQRICCYWTSLCLILLYLSWHDHVYLFLVSWMHISENIKVLACGVSQEFLGIISSIIIILNLVLTYNALCLNTSKKNNRINTCFTE